MIGSRKAFSLIELLVVIAIIAILLGLLLPAVQKVREAAQRLTCQNNLKQLALACHNYENANEGLPAIGAATTDPAWVLQLLPFVEQGALYSQYNFSLPWFDRSNANVRVQRLPVLECPANPTQQRIFTATNAPFATLDPNGTPDVTYSAASTDYFAFMGANVACYNQFYPGTPGTADLSGALLVNGKRRFVSIPDGSSNTAMLSEMAGRPAIYLPGGQLNTAQPSQTYGFGAWVHNNSFNVNCYTFDGKTTGGPCVVNCSNFRAVYSYHAVGAYAAFADGSVHLLPQAISGKTFYALVTSAGGEVVQGFDN
jgi:prepilin-type N-terminal cleavage/methylation domain-containing protein